ncbi:hypothetical protein [uncultured Ferrimonas sp.]|uniref:DUF7832 domain-containing protein n=1 Tax=uncultured Ferrimonas sp. TaxID=432640 RepID=UPI0026062A81|nr:hypothetical protein [uncultured Ferrimonas sp.]
MKYDDASWHYGGDYPKGLSEQNAHTHTGIFLAWALTHGLAGDLHKVEWPEEIEAVKSKLKTGGQFLSDNCDGKFTDEDLNELGNKFASEFYENEYFTIYIETSDPYDNYETIYHVPDTWETYERVAPIITKHFEAWVQSNT